MLRKIVDGARYGRHIAKYVVRFFRAFIPSRHDDFLMDEKLLLHSSAKGHFRQTTFRSGVRLQTQRHLDAIGRILANELLLDKLNLAFDFCTNPTFLYNCHRLAMAATIGRHPSSAKSVIVRVLMLRFIAGYTGTTRRFFRKIRLNTDVFIFGHKGIGSFFSFGSISEGLSIESRRHFR